MSYNYKVSNGGCHSQLRILRAASTHYGVLRTLLNHVYTARRSHLCVVSIDKAPSAGDFHSLMETTKVHDVADLLTADLDSSHKIVIMESTIHKMKNISIGTTPPANNPAPVTDSTAAAASTNTAATNTSAKPKQKHQGQRRRYTPYVS